MADSPQILAEAERAHGNATALLSPERWAEGEAPTFDGSDLYPARCENKHQLSANSTAHSTYTFTTLYSVAVRVAGIWKSFALNLVIVIDWGHLGGSMHRSSQQWHVSGQGVAPCRRSCD